MVLRFCALKTGLASLLEVLFRNLHWEFHPLQRIVGRDRINLIAPLLATIFPHCDQLPPQHYLIQFCMSQFFLQAFIFCNLDHSSQSLSQVTEPIPYSIDAFMRTTTVIFCCFHDSLHASLLVSMSNSRSCTDFIALLLAASLWPLHLSHSSQVKLHSAF